jgi:3-oxoacyl-[acyl-carrier-protein] synthase-1
MVAPSGEGAIRCMKQALATVKNRVDYVNTHGTSTPVGDQKEIGAIRTVFGDDLPHIQSTKSLTGHSLGAAGVQEAIYSILMMQERFIGESAHIQTLDPEFEGVPIVRKRIDNAKIDTALSNSFGFGGTNATLVFERFNG